MRWNRALVVVAAVLALGAGAVACSDDDGDAGAGDAGTTTAIDDAEGDTSDDGGGAEEDDMDVDRPAGPVPELRGPLTAGGPPRLAAATTGPDLEAAGWVEEEFVVAGTATSYRSEGELPADGAYDLVAGDKADYATRIVVRRPADAADFAGTVVVEWLNVSGGFDANPDYSYLGTELIRGGYAWVGVSSQHIGVEGGPVAVRVEAGELAGAGKGLKAIDPERYGDLSHPGDAYSYDIYTQVARALREPGAVDPLGGLRPEVLLAVGESQSGFALTTYVNGVHPLAGQYDGFLVHSRGAAAAPLGEPGTGIDIASTVVGPPTRIRTDQDAPVLVLESETDVLGFLGYHRARQDDSDRFRLWEMAGTAHADEYLLGPIAELVGCPKPLNAGPHHFVAKSALRHLDRWVRDGEAPPEAPRLDVEGEAFVRDPNGNAEGGIRTPQVDVPVDTLSGDAVPGADTACALFGSTTPLPEERLRELYESPDAYLEAYREAADAAVASGFVLEDDREELLADADPDRVAGALAG